jgi:hypothetical protein
MDNGCRIDANIIEVSKAFDLVLHERVLRKLRPREWIRGTCMDERISTGRYTET